VASTRQHIKAHSRQADARLRCWLRVNVIYPPENAALAQQLYTNVLCCPKFTPTPPRRLMVDAAQPTHHALKRAVIVVEAARLAAHCMPHAATRSGSSGVRHQ